MTVMLGYSRKGVKRHRFEAEKLFLRKIKKTLKNV